MAGLHGETIRKVRIIRNAWLEDKQRWQRLVNDGLSDDESVSINYAYKEVIKSQKHKTPRKLPEGEFDVILADPPWDYDMEVGRGTARLQYPTIKKTTSQSSKYQVQPMQCFSYGQQTQK